MESWGRMLAIILAVILLFIVPIRYEAQKTEISIDSYVATEVDYFFHSILERHELTQQMYDEFCNRLVASGCSYRIEIERYNSIVSSEDSSQSYLEYEDLLELLTSTGEVKLNEKEYILVRVKKQNQTIVDRLRNLFLPTGIEHSVYSVGGEVA